MKIKLHVLVSAVRLGRPLDLDQKDEACIDWGIDQEYIDLTVNEGLLWTNQGHIMARELEQIQMLVEKSLDYLSASIQHSCSEMKRAKTLSEKFDWHYRIKIQRCQLRKFKLAFFDTCNRATEAFHYNNPWSPMGLHYLDKFFELHGRVPDRVPQSA